MNGSITEIFNMLLGARKKNSFFLLLGEEARFMTLGRVLMTQFICHVIIYVSINNIQFIESDMQNFALKL